MVSRSAQRIKDAASQYGWEEKPQGHLGLLFSKPTSVGGWEIYVLFDKAGRVRNASLRTDSGLTGSIDRGCSGVVTYLRIFGRK